MALVRVLLSFALIASMLSAYSVSLFLPNVPILISLLKNVRPVFKDTKVKMEFAKEFSAQIDMHLVPMESIVSLFLLSAMITIV